MRWDMTEILMWTALVSFVVVVLAILAATAGYFVVLITLAQTFR